jgi:hypothetical protein
VAAQLSLPGCARGGDEIRERAQLHRRARRDPEEVIDHRHHRNEVGQRIVGQPLVQQRIDGDHAGEGEQEGVLVARVEERGDRGNAVATLTVLHHYSVAPALGETLGEESRREVGSASRRERHYEAHGPLWPTLRRLGWRRRGQGAHGHCGHGGESSNHAHGISPAIT